MLASSVSVGLGTEASPDLVTPNADNIFAIGSDEALRLRGSELAVECARLQRENDELRQRLGMQTAAVESVPSIAPDPIPSCLAGTLTNGSPAASKISLFRALFRGRDDVFAVRWIGKDGKAGYSPAEPQPDEIAGKRKRLVAIPNAHLAD